MSRRTALIICLALLIMLAVLTVCLILNPPPAEPAPPESAAQALPAEDAPEPAVETPEPTPSLPPPPDIDIDGWEFLYAGLNNGVGRYHPPVANFEMQYLDKRMLDYANDFLAAAREQGYEVYVGVAYRNFEYNMYRFENAIRDYGSSYEAAKHVFPPGTSEHSTGLAFDITDEMDYSANYYEMHDETVADTEVYKWMAEHCQEYGFIVRYPEGKEEFYGRACYPGHFRYVGVEAATYIMENDLCLEEFLALYE